MNKCDNIIDGTSKEVSFSAREVFKRFPDRADKRLGQNFLFDPKINKRIVDVAGSLDGKIIAEIGPGPGGLTVEILKQNVQKLYVIEADPHWAEVWRNLQRNYFQNKLEVVECDALKFDMRSISPQIIISNLPYNISMKLLVRFWNNFSDYECLVLMFQKEVAERICAKSGTKIYGKPSVLAQWLSRVIKIFELEPGSFFPPPKVKSTVLKFEPYKSIKGIEHLHFFSKMLDEVFRCRRKIILKSLQKFSPNAEEVIKQLGYSATTRAEEIKAEDYVKIMLNFLPK